MAVGALERDFVCRVHQAARARRCSDASAPESAGHLHGYHRYDAAGPSSPVLENAPIRPDRTAQPAARPSVRCGTNGQPPYRDLVQVVGAEGEERRERPSTVDPLPTPGAFRVLRRLHTRWADNDVYGHVNNVVYYNWFDDSVNGWLIDATGTDIRALPAFGVVVETSCRYLRELSFPDVVQVGVGLEHRGRTSVIYRLAVFRESPGGTIDPAPHARWSVRARVRRRHHAPAAANPRCDPSCAGDVDLTTDEQPRPCGESAEPRADQAGREHGCALVGALPCRVQVNANRALAYLGWTEATQVP